MAVHSLKPATDRRLGRPLPYQLANQTRVHLIAINLSTHRHAPVRYYAVLAVVSNCCPPLWGRLPTRYSPVRHSVTKSSFRRNQIKCFVRLACVKHAASVHPEPGSNSHVIMFDSPQNKNLAAISQWLSSFYPFSSGVSFTKLSYFIIRNWIGNGSYHSSFFIWIFSILFSELFKVVSLFSYQGSFLTLVLKKLFFGASANTILPKKYCIVNTFFATFFKKFQNKSVTQYLGVLCLSNRKKLSFSYAQTERQSCNKTGLSLTEKEGFEPSRRANDLHP